MISWCFSSPEDKGVQKECVWATGLVIGSPVHFASLIPPYLVGVLVFSRDFRLPNVVSECFLVAPVHSCPLLVFSWTSGSSLTQ